MIKVNTRKNHIEISGHAMYDEIGKDIVCSSVSSIVITSINAVLRFDNKAINYEEKDGFMKIDILSESNETKLIILNMIDMLKQLEKQYKNNIKIYEEV